MRVSARACFAVVSMIVGVTSLGAVAIPSAADRPCKPLQPPDPICIPSPLPTLSVPSVPTLPPVPTVPPVSVPTPNALPTVPQITITPTPLPTLPPITIPPTPLPTHPTPTQSPPTLPPIGGGGIRTPWIPANAGVMWYGPGAFAPLPSQPVGDAGGSLWLTRRLAVAPTQPTHMLMGSLVNGVYVSQGGAAWASATPGCLLPYTSPVGAQALWSLARQIAILASGLDVCGIEGLAFDPLIPGRVYASGFDTPTLTSFNPGGVYVSEDNGLHWVKLLGGIRGAGLAVGRPPGSAFATIVAGYIQQDNNNVGATPNNGSLSISNNDGLTWRHVVLPASGCADGVGTSQRLTATVAFNAVDQRIVYAGTNAGLYVSTDAGATWRLARQSCGGLWGIGPARDGRVYLGDNAGVVYEADPAVSTMRQIADVGVGYVQSIEADFLDPGRAYAAVWSGGAASVYRIDAPTGQVAQLGNSLLLDLPSSMPQPFPFSFQHRNGTAPSLFLARPPGRLFVSTVLRGAFLRGE